MTARAPRSLVREAFHGAGEKRYWLARLAYPRLLGPAWGYALLGWGYLKTLDDVVDEDPSAQRSVGVLKAQGELIERTYAGVGRGGPLSRSETFGECFFRWDRDCGAPLRASMEAVLETMEFDIRRRGQIFSTAEIDDYIVKMGGALVDYLAHFAAPGLALPVGLREASSRAYLYADTLMDLDHDLSFGLINIPSEDLEAGTIDPDHVDAHARERWIRGRIAEVEGYFDAALTSFRELPTVTGAWCRLLLGEKRKKFHRFLAEERIR